MSNQLLQVEDLQKTYVEGELTTPVLHGISLCLSARTSYAIQGSSGSGKSTLLQIIGGLDKPTSGQVIWQGQDLTKLKDKALSRFRNESLGFVYQFHHLLPEFTLLENVLMPLKIGQKLTRPGENFALELIDKVGLSHRLMHKPSQLSGGERQRVALARALVNRPLALLADEPTGNLDSTNAQKVADLLVDLQKELGMTLVLVTHDQAFAEKFDVIGQMHDGQLRWLEQNPPETT